MGSQPSTYYRAGYTVEGAPDTIVDPYCRSEREAEIKAIAAAEIAKKQLEELGVPAKIHVWHEKWQSWTETETFPRRGCTDLAVMRPRDPIDLYSKRMQGETVEVKDR
jgi:hypothetical protein